MPPKFQRNTRAMVLGTDERPEASETDALFGLSGTLPQLIEADVDLILANPDQARTVFDETALAGLAASIEQVGLQQPILIRTANEKGRYILVAGERRLRAYRRLGRKTIPAILTRGRPEEVTLIENIQRVDLDALDLARGISRLIELHGYTQAAAGALIGCTEAEISRRLSVLRLPEDILDDYRKRAGDVSRSLLIEIATIDDVAQQRELWHKAISQGLTIRALRLEKQKEKRPEEAEERVPRRRHPSLKAIGRHLSRITEDVERMAVVRHELHPEHRQQLQALRNLIDALLTEEPSELTTS